MVNAILCLRKFLWKFRHSFNCTTRVVPILQAVFRRMVDGFVKQRGHYHHHSVSIWCGWPWSRVARCTSFPQRSLSPSLHLVRFAASSTSNPMLFTFSSTCLLISTLVFLDFAAHSLPASMPSLEHCLDLS